VSVSLWMLALLGAAFAGILLGAGIAIILLWPERE